MISWSKCLTKKLKLEWEFRIEDVQVWWENVGRSKGNNGLSGGMMIWKQGIIGGNNYEWQYETGSEKQWGMIG